MVMEKIKPIRKFTLAKDISWSYNKCLKKNTYNFRWSESNHSISKHFHL